MNCTKFEVWVDDSHEWTRRRKDDACSLYIYIYFKTHILNEWFKTWLIWICALSLLYSMLLAALMTHIIPAPNAIISHRQLHITHPHTIWCPPSIQIILQSSSSITAGWKHPSESDYSTTKTCTQELSFHTTSKSVQGYQNMCGKIGESDLFSH